MPEQKSTGFETVSPARLPERGRRYAPRRPERQTAPSRSERPSLRSSASQQASGQVFSDIGRSLPVSTTIAERPARPAPHVHDVKPLKPSSITARQASTARPALPRQHKSLVLKRQIKQNAVQHKLQSRELRKVQLKAFVLGGAAVVMVIAGIGFAHAISSSKPAVGTAAVSAALGASTSNQPGGNLDESPVTAAAIAAYKTQGDTPQQLLIPKLGIQARVLSTNLSINGEPIPVANIHDVGWLQSSARPGASGTILMNGSTAGPTKAGIFSGITNLVVGDTIQIVRGDGKTISYKVVSAKSYPADKVDMKAAQQPAIAGKNGLNILTDTGRFNIRSNQFENRVLVFAVQE